MKSRKWAFFTSTSFRWGISLAISVVAFGLAFRDVRLADMAAALRQTNFFYIALVVVINLAGLYARALSWYIILGRQIAYPRVFRALNAGYLLNNVLPFRLGEMGRAYLVSQGGSISRAISSVLVERVIDLVMIVGLLGVFLPLVVGLSWARQAALTWVLATGLALVGLLVLARSRGWVLALFRRSIVLLPRLNGPYLETRLGAFIDGMGALRDGRRFAGAALCSGLAWLAAGVGCSLLLLALPIPLNTSIFVVGFFALVVCGLGAALPSAPASAGVWELSVIAALSVFRVETSLALSYALIYHLVFVATTGVLGALALAREGESLAHLAQKVQTLMDASRLPAGVSVE